MRVPVLILNTPNTNNVIYSTESVQNSFAPNGVYMGRIDVPTSGVDVDITEAAFTVTNLAIEGEELVGTVTILDNSQGNVLKALLCNIVFRPNGTGALEDGFVNNYKLASFSAIVKRNDA